MNNYLVDLNALPNRIVGFMPRKGGCFIAVPHARMDFRGPLPIGNFMAIIRSLPTTEQAEMLKDFIKVRWTDPDVRVLGFRL